MSKNNFKIKDEVFMELLILRDPSARHPNLFVL